MIILKKGDKVIIKENALYDNKKCIKTTYKIEE